MPMSADLGWTAQQWPGLEHVIVTADEAGYRADGHVIMAEDGLVTVRYQLRCDPGWRFTGLDISVTSAAGQRDLDRRRSAPAGPVGVHGHRHQLHATDQHPAGPPPGLVPRRRP